MEMLVVVIAAWGIMAGYCLGFEYGKVVGKRRAKKIVRECISEIVQWPVKNLDNLKMLSNEMLDTFTDILDA
jgi:hypothetical protein